MEQIDFEKPGAIKDCIFGSEGIGKTRLAAQWPKPYWLDSEHSTDTIISLIKAGLIPPDNIPGGARVNSIDEADQAVKFAMKEGYETIVVDTATRLQKKQMSVYVADQKTVKDGIRDRWTRYQQDYLWSNNRLDDWFMELIELPINVLIIAHDLHEYEIKNPGKPDEYKVLLEIRPNLPPKLSSSLTEQFSVVGYYHAKEDISGKLEKRLLQVNAGKKVIAKNRLNIQDMHVENPTFDFLHNQTHSDKK